MAAAPALARDGEVAEESRPTPFPPYPPGDRHAQFNRPTAEGQGPLEFTDNIFRLNIKIGLKHGVLPRVMDADADE